MSSSIQGSRWTFELAMRLSKGVANSVLATLVRLALNWPADFPSCRQTSAFHVVSARIRLEGTRQLRHRDRGTGLHDVVRAVRDVADRRGVAAVHVVHDRLHSYCVIDGGLEGVAESRAPPRAAWRRRCEQVAQPVEVGEAEGQVPRQLGAVRIEHHRPRGERQVEGGDFTVDQRERILDVASEVSFDAEQRERRDRARQRVGRAALRVVGGGVVRVVERRQSVLLETVVPVAVDRPVIGDLVVVRDGAIFEAAVLGLAGRDATAAGGAGSSKLKIRASSFRARNRMCRRRSVLVATAGDG